MEIESSLGAYQKALWFQQSYPVTSPTNNMTSLVTCRLPLKLKNIEFAAKTCYQTYPLLRAYFVESEGDVRIKLQHQDSLDYDVVDLTHINPAARVEQIKKKASESIDIKRSCIKLTFFLVGSAETIILISWHHIIGDIFSLNVFLKTFLEALFKEKRSEFHESGNYFDFIHWQKEFISSDKAIPHKDYWKSKIEKLKDLPLDIIRLGSAEIYNFSFSKVEIESINAYCKKVKLTLAQFFFIAYQLFLHDIYGSERILTIVPVNTRFKSEFLQSIGYYVNFTFLVSEYVGGESVSLYREKMRNQFVENLFHSSFPVNELFDITDSTYENMFKNIYKFQNESIFEEQLSGYRGVVESFGSKEKILSLDDNLVNFPRGEMTLVVSVSQDLVRCALHFVVGRFEDAERFPFLFREKVDVLLAEL